MISLKKFKKSLAFALFFILLISSSCAGNVFELKEDGSTGNLIDEENELYYIFCRGYLRAAGINSEPYAKVGSGRQRFFLHEIPGLEPSKWLSENIETEGVPFVFREKSVEEPTLADFEAEIIHITITGAITLQVGSTRNQNEITAIVNDFLYGAEVPAPDFIDPDLMFTLNFASQKYSGLYYILEYRVDHLGNNYLYCRWSNNLEGRWVLCSVDLLR